MVEAVSILAGAVLTLAIGVLRRRYKIERGTINSLVIVLSFLIAFGIQYYETRTLSVALESAGLIYATSQAVYQLIIKQFEFDVKLEGKG